MPLNKNHQMILIGVFATTDIGIWAVNVSTRTKPYVFHQPESMLCAVSPAS